VILHSQKAVIRLALLSLLIAALFPLPLDAAQDLRKLVGQNENLTRLLPNEQLDSGRILIPRHQQCWPFTSASRVNPATGELTYRFASPAYEFSARVDKGLQVMDSEIRYSDKKLIEKLGHDRRTTTLKSQAQDTMTIACFKGGQKIDEKAVDHDFFTLNLDLVQAALQALSLKGIREFKCQAVLPSKGWKAGVIFTLKETADFTALAPQYNFPPEIKNAFPSKKRFYVWEMKLSGALGLVYTDRYYCVLRKDKPHRFAAYFGGDPRWVEFIICPDRF